jgi:N-acetylglucosamine-6-sulfatase
VSGRARLGALACCLALGLAGCAGGEDQPGGGTVPGTAYGGSPARPNILVIYTDDQDVRSLAVMPNVRRLLARHGTTFARNFASFPECCPSRATMITGQYAHNHGVRSNDPDRGGYQALRGRRDTLGVWMQRAGYRTAYIGKFLNGWGLNVHYGIPPGWSDWEVPVEETYLLMYGYQLDDNGRVVKYGSKPSDYQTDVLAKRTQAFVRQSSRDGKPFLCVFAPLAPHQEADYLQKGGRDPRPAPRDANSFASTPLPTPPSFDERDVRDKPPVLRAPHLSATDRTKLLGNYRGRLGSLLAVDDAVGRLVRTLRREDELDRTTIVFTSDNGFLLGEHRLTGKKPVLYEELTRVPLIVRGPGFPAGERVRAPVANVDLAPTMLDLARGEATRRLDGTSLVGVAAEPGPWRNRTILLENQGVEGLRVDQFAYAEYRNGGAELYDLRRDPYELRNLHGSPRYATLEAKLARRLHSLRHCSGASCLEAGRRPLGPR